MEINDVYEEHGNYIRRTICSIVDKKYGGNLPSLYAEIEDIENECWLLISKQLKNFNPEKASLKTFLVLIAKSQINMLYKKDCNSKNLAMRTSHSIDKEQSEEENYNLHGVLSEEDDLLVALEKQQMLQDIFQCLTDEEAQYLKLHIMQRIPLKEINHLLNWNVSENSLNTKSSRLLKKIRNKILANLEKSIVL